MTNAPNAINVLNVIKDHLAGHIAELEIERKELATRLVEVNRDLVVAYSLQHVAPTPAVRTIVGTSGAELRLA